MVIVNYTNLTNQECIMDKGSKIVSRLATALVITLFGVGCILVPHLNNFFTWTAEIVIVCWILILLWFIVIFKKFNKEQKEKGS